MSDTNKSWQHTTGSHTVDWRMESLSWGYDIYMIFIYTYIIERCTVWIKNGIKNEHKSLKTVRKKLGSRLKVYFRDVDGCVSAMQICVFFPVFSNNFFSIFKFYFNFYILSLLFWDIFPTKDMQTPLPPSHRIGHIYMEDAHSADSNEKSYVRFFRFLFFWVMADRI